MLAATIRKYRNAGAIDRVLRTIIGVVLIYFGFINTSFIGQDLLATLVGIMGIVNLFVATSGICPVYTVAGINTCRSSEAQRSGA